MARFQSPRRSDEEWFRLINECRRSGLSDSLWCKQQAIPVSSFFCAVRRLREKAYALPERERSIDIVSNPLSVSQGRYRWPRNKSEVRNLTWQEFDRLMSGLDIDQPKAIKVDYSAAS